MVIAWGIFSHSFAVMDRYVTLFWILKCISIKIRREKYATNVIIRTNDCLQKCQNFKVLTASGLLCFCTFSYCCIVANFGIIRSVYVI